MTFSIVTFLSTLFGGLFALRFRGQVHLMLSFTAGVLMAIMLLHILPEIRKITESSGYGLATPLVPAILGFFGFYFFHRFLHRHHDHEQGHKRPVVGVTSALALASHSFLDGVAIGLAFQVNTSVGIAVALAVIAHDFADGLNAVSVMLAYKNSIRRSLLILALVALAPVAGVLSTMFVQIPEVALLWYLGGFAGFITYLLSKDILPYSFKGGRLWLSSVLMLFGLAFVYVVTNLTAALE